jgi:hypothetical protein
MFAIMKATPRFAKVRGELTEIRFLLMAAACGLIVCKPWGESQPFDFVVYCKLSGRFHRVQVKLSTHWDGAKYTVNTGHSGNRRHYTAAQIDFIAAYVAPKMQGEQTRRRGKRPTRRSAPLKEAIWYIIPVRKIGRSRVIGVFPHNPQSRGKYEPYRDAWQLLR